MAFRLSRALAVVLLVVVGGAAAGRATPALDSSVARRIDGFLDTALGRGGLLDRGLGALEGGIHGLRQVVQDERLPTRPSAASSVALDASLAGCLAGFGCGVVLIGDPKVLAVAGALSFAAATRWPDPQLRLADRDGRIIAASTLRASTPGQICVACAHGGSRGVARLRAMATDHGLRLPFGR